MAFLKTGDGGNGGSSGGSVSVTGDGVKTWSQLLNNLFNLIDFSKINNKSVLVFGSGVYGMNTLTSTDVRFSRSRIDATAETINVVIVKLGSTSWYTGVEIGANTSAVSDLSNQIVANGSTIAIYY